MKTYQINNENILTHENPEYTTKPYKAIVVPPPALNEGQLARWVSDLDPVTALNYGDESTGYWEVLPDYRDKKLYSTSNGAEYSGEYKGVGELPEGVTDKPRPDDTYIFENGEWVQDALLLDAKKEGELNAVKESKRLAVQQFMDRKAQSLGYDSLSNAISYADEPAVPKYQQEGLALREWRSLVWQAALPLINDITDVETAISNDDLIASLPQLNITNSF